MAHLRMEFLGGFRVTLDGTPITTFESNKVRALLAYLAIESQRPHPRESLATLLWSDWPDRAALSNLRYALSDLRKVIGDRTADPPFLLISREAIQFNIEGDHSLDVAEFNSLADSQDAEQLKQAISFYKSEFLEGFSASEAAPFEDWRRLKGEQLQRLFMDTLHKLAALLEAEGEYEHALPYARRQVEVEPLDESSQRQVMRMLALNGRRAEALAQYEACRNLLQHELQAEPSAETMQLYQLLLKGELIQSLSTEQLHPERSPRRVGKCPYRGLSAFQEADAPFYFGREAFVDVLERAIHTRKMIAVIVGSSGSGKSSALFAGLLPRLRQAGGYQFAIFRPGDQPFYALAGALMPLLEPDLSETDRLTETRKLAERLSLGEISLVEVAGRILEKSPVVRQILLVVDQFEELYTLCPEARLQNAFIDGLLAMVQAAKESPDGLAVILLTMRADFMGQALAHRSFADALQEASLLMGPMNREELQMAIEKPAEMQGAAFETGLVKRILDDVGEKPGNLPLLEFTLTQLWERQTDGWLTHTDYEAMGSVEGALAAYADQVYESLGASEQERARGALSQLVQPGEGTEDTRRIANRQELGDESWILIQRLADQRLVVTGLDAAENEIAEVVHEALIQKWGRFREWMDADRLFRLWQERLRGNLRQWQESHCDEGALLAGAPLSVAEGWLVERGDNLNQAEREYIQESQARQTRKQKERQRRRQWTVLSLAAGLFVALILAGVALGFAKRNSALAAQNAESARFANTQQAIAIDQESIAAQSAATAVAAREEAEGLASLRSRDAQVNQSLALAAQSQLARQADNVDLALALAMEANRIPDPPGPAQMALSEAAYAPGTVRVFLGHEAPVQSVAVSPDGRYGISGDESGLVILWNLDTGEVLRRLEGHTDTVASLAFTPDGRHAVSASQDKTLIYWDLEEGEIIRRLTGHIDAVNTVAVSPDGRFAASGSGRGGEDEENSLRLWDLQSGQEARRFTFFRYSVNDVSFTPNGEHLVVGTETEGFIVLNIKTGKALVRNNIIGMMAEVVVTPDGRFALTADSDYSIHIWDLQTGQVVTELESHNSTIYGLAISPDGKRALGGSKVVIEYDLETGEQLNQFNFGANAIAYLPNGHAALVGSQDQTLRLLALESGTEIGRLPASIDWIRGAAYSPQGRTLVANDTQYLSLWDLETGDNIWNATADTSFWEITLSPDGKQILVGGWGGFVGVYDAASGEMLNRLESDGSFEGHDTGAWVDTVAFHPNGKFALSGSQATGDHLIYWDLETGKPVWLFDTGWRNVLGVAISPDGRTALSAEEDGSLELWDLETGQLIRSLAGHTNVAWSVAFIDDQTAISASEDSTMILWDLKSGTALRSFLGHASGIKRVVISPDKRLALSASRDGTLILWNIQNGEPLRHYAGHTDELMTVAWHPDGEEALSGGRDGQAIRWRIDADLETFLNWVEGNRYVRRLTCAERDAFNAEPLCDSASLLPAARPDGTPTPVQGSQAALLPPLPTPTPLASSPATAPLVAEAAGAAAWGVNRGSVHLGGGQVWEYAGNAGDQLSILVAADQPANMTWGIERQRENGLLDPTMSLYAPDGSLLTEDDDLEEGIATDAYLESITLPQTGIYQIEVRSYQDQTGGSYRLVLADPRRLAFQVNPDGMLSGLAFYPDGQRLLVSEGWKYSPDSNSFSIWVWDLASDEMIQQLDGHQEWITGLALSPDGRQALSADAAGVAILWDLESGEEIRRFDNSGSGILFLPDGQTALMASRDWSLALWDLASGEVIRRFEGHADEVRKVVLSQDGEVAYSTSADQTVRAWRVATGELIATYQPFASESTCGLAISPDSRKLLVGNDWSYCVGLDPMDAAIALLDTETGETLLTLEGHTGGVRSIAFSPDGRYALSGAGDTTVRLWDVSTGKQLAVLTGHTSWVSQVAFSSDGLTGYSTGEDGSFRVWDLSEFIGTEPSASTEN